MCLPEPGQLTSSPRLGTRPGERSRRGGAEDGGAVEEWMVVVLSGQLPEEAYVGEALTLERLPRE